MTSPLYTHLPNPHTRTHPLIRTLPPSPHLRLLCHRARLNLSFFIVYHKFTPKPQSNPTFLLPPRPFIPPPPQPLLTWTPA